MLAKEVIPGLCFFQEHYFQLAQYLQLYTLENLHVSLKNDEE